MSAALSHTQARATEYLNRCGTSVVLRSKTEAVFGRALELAGWRWWYELAGLRKPGSRYIPDFFAIRLHPDGEGLLCCLFEVKPARVTATYLNEIARWTMLPNKTQEQTEITQRTMFWVVEGGVFGGPQIWTAIIDGEAETFDFTPGRSRRNSTESLLFGSLAEPVIHQYQNARTYRFDLKVSQ